MPRGAAGGDGAHLGPEHHPSALLPAAMLRAEASYSG